MLIRKQLEEEEKNEWMEVFFVWRNGNSRKENEEDFVKDGSRLKNGR